MNLYHFTSFESAIKILTTETILFSRIETLNDINESSGIMILSESNTEIHKLLDKYTQISLTTDKGQHKGYDIPAMWGHYASRGHGVCIVLDKDKIVKEVKRRGLYSREVEYSNNILPNDYEYDVNLHGTPRNFINMAKDSLFFRKTADWQYEQEYRIVAVKNNVKPLEIKNSLKSVILYSRNHENFINSIECRVLSRIVDINIIYRYAMYFHKGNLYDINGNSLTTINYDVSLTSGCE